MAGDEGSSDTLHIDKAEICAADAALNIHTQNRQIWENPDSFPCLHMIHHATQY